MRQTENIFTAGFLARMGRKLPLRQRFFVGAVSGVVTLMVLLLGLDLVSQRMNGQLYQVFDDDLAFVEEAGQTTHRLAQIQLDLEGYLSDYLWNRFDAEALVVKIDHLSEDLQAAFRDNAHLTQWAVTGTDGGTPRDVLDRLARYRLAVVAAVELIEVDPERARDSAAYARQEFNQIVVGLSGLLHSYDVALRTELTRVHQQADQAIWLWGGLAVALAAVSLILTFFFARQLSFELSGLLKGIERIADGGDPGDLTQVAADPSLARIAAAVETFHGVMDELSRHKSELERIIADRTQSLTEANERLKLYLSAFRSTDEAIIITDNRSNILDVNDAYLRITQYDRDEVIGANPGKFKSGRHDAGFYRTMWDALDRDGRWAGEIWDRRKDGEYFPKWLVINAVKDASGTVTHFVGVFVEISEMKATEAKLEALAYKDGLTDLPNRVLFHDRLDRALAAARRRGGAMAVMLLDLDRFKEVNDTLGHSTGDALLCAVADRLRQALRETDTLARLGGDEFTVILDSVPDECAVVGVAEKIEQVLQAPFELDGHSIDVRASIGISMFPRDGRDPETLVKAADVAMYDAKRRRGGGHALFRAEMNRSSVHRLSLSSRLGLAMKEDRFRLHYQPIVDLETGELRGAEALIRWQETDDGPLTPPGEFIPYAEETGMILSIERWVLRKAVAQVMEWHHRGVRDLQVSVNISARHFARGDKLVSTIRDILSGHPGIGRRLVIELTETTLIHDAEAVRKVMLELGQLGVPVAIDDFGTGFSGLNYLVDFPVSVVKLDKSFIQACDDPVRRSITEAVVSLSGDLGRLSIAEGIETEEQRQAALSAGCPLGQGYLFGKAVPPEQFDLILQRQGAGRAICGPMRQVG